MNVGLPGTGIGGLFYLVTACLMPFVELIQTFRGQSSLKRWRVVCVQFSLAAGVVFGLWATAWCIKALAPKTVIFSIKSTRSQITHALGVTPTALTIYTLASVLLAVEALRFIETLFSRLVLFVRLKRT